MVALEPLPDTAMTSLLRFVPKRAKGLWEEFDVGMSAVGAGD